MTQYQAGDRVIFTQKGWNNRRLPTMDYALTRAALGVLTIRDAEAIQIDDVPGAQDITFEEIPFNALNIDVRLVW